MYCQRCGTEMEFKIPIGDNRARFVCASCGFVAYENPKMVVGTIPVWKNQVLLCRRAIEPRHGFWTLPAGFMEMDETTQEGALRETHEEAGAQIQMGRLFSVMNVKKANQVHFFYLAQLTSLELNPGEETLEARLFSEADIPWNDLAFQTVIKTLEWFFQSQVTKQLTGDFVHHFSIGNNH